MEEKSTENIDKSSSEKVGITLDKWTDEIEGILIEWSEKALCYRWLHTESKKIFENIYNKYIIPIIIFSTVSGTVNIGMKAVVPDNYLLFAQVGVGFVNIFTGILSTLLNFFKYAEKKQSHETSAVLWHKFYRGITTELALSPEKRRNVNDFFKIYRAEYDSIINQSLELDEDIIYMFNKKFKKELRKGEIKVPEIVCHIQKSKDYQEYVLERKQQKEKLKEIYSDKDAKEVKEEKKEDSVDTISIDIDSKSSDVVSVPIKKNTVSNMIKLFESKLQP